MVLTRLSHFGEACPLSDHSYSDPAPPASLHQPARKVSGGALKVCGGVAPLAPHTSSSTASMPGPAPSPSLNPPVPEEPSVEPVAASPLPPPPTIHILDLPNEIFEKIFSYLTYKKIGELRRTCRRFEVIGSTILNTTFQRLQTKMLKRFQAIKGQMPRRESARRKHPLARESDIVETLHMRLTLLQMSFGKHIERKHCCFFAGDILDEVFRIWWYIRKTPNLARAYKVTDELFDLSTMAMEYFKEHIEPGLPEITYFGSDFLDITSRFSEGVRSPSGSGRVSEPDDEIPERDPSDPLPPSNMVLRKRIRRIRQGMRRYNTQLVALKRELKGCKSKITDQHRQIVEYATRMDEYDKKFEESSRKFSTVLQELNKCKTELQCWRSKSPAHPLLCYNCGQTVGEGASQPLQAGVLMQRGEDALVYVPLPAVPIPESVEKAGPPVGREEARDHWQAIGGSVRNLEKAFDLDLPTPVTQGLHKAQGSAPQPTSPHSSSSSPQPSASRHILSAPKCSKSTSSSSVPLNVAEMFQSTEPVSASSTVPSPLLCTPSAHTGPVSLSSSLSSLQCRISSQTYSAFRACSSTSQDLGGQLWDMGQDCPQDLSVSRQRCLDDEGESSGLKRRSSDEDSDDVRDDTVGRRVKERKRSKLDGQ